MKKLTLNVESLSVESFSAAPEVEQSANVLGMVSRNSCIEQCTTSCVP